MEKGKVVTGSRVKLQIAGKPIAYATVATYAETITYDAVAVLDQMEIAEHVPVAYDVAFSCSRIFTTTESLKSMEIFPKGGQNSSDLLTNLLELGTKGELTATIVDAKAETIVTLHGVKITSHNLTFGSRSVVGEDISFVAIRAIDALAAEK